VASGVWATKGTGDCATATVAPPSAATWLAAASTNVKPLATSEGNMTTSCDYDNRSPRPVGRRHSNQYISTNLYYCLDPDPVPPLAVWRAAPRRLKTRIGAGPTRGARFRYLPPALAAASP